MVAAKALPLLVDPLLVATRPGTTSSLVKFIAFSVTESLRFDKDEAFKRKPVVDPFVVSNGNLPLSAIVALALGAQSELTRTNLLASLNEDEDEEPPTVLPWDWERMLQVSGLAFARDTGGQTVQRVIEAAAEVRARPVPPRPAPADRRRPPPTAPRRLPLLRRSRASPTRSSTRW